MEAETGNANHQPRVLNRMLPAVLPVLLISIGYVDPGKWVATVEGGARFGFNLVAPMLLFNCAAILFQYLSARIGVVTGRDLAQICSDEYDKSTRVFIGVQAELSMVVLDLTMVLGVAHGINFLLGVDLSTGVFLAALDAVLFPVFATLLDHCRASFLCIYAAGFILLAYVFGVLVSQPEKISLSTTGLLTKLNGESAFALMSLLGASIMPHNFYLHSFIVQQHQGPPNISKSALCQSHLFAIFCAFSGISLVNYVLMNSAANVFYSEGLVLVTFQDAMSLMEQVFRNGIVPLLFLLVMFLSNQITASAWNLGGQVVLNDFFGFDFPGWLHRVTIRIIAMVPALFCVWTSGAEGIYQLLIFAQVMVALLLPSSVIPLFRIASSRPIMGVYKISSMVEFLALVTFMGMLGLKMVFVAEMVFGNSDWVDNLRLNAGFSTSIPFIGLLVIACASFSLMLWLAATPLKSASSRSEAHASKWNLNRTVPKTAIESIENYLSETRYHGEESARVQEWSSTPEMPIEGHSDLSFPNCDLDLPETIMESDREVYLTTVNEKSSNTIYHSPSACNTPKSTSVIESAPTVVNEVVNDDLPGTKNLEIEPMKPVEKTVSVEGDLLNEKDDNDDGDSWEPEEPSKPRSGSISNLTLDGPPSFRSLSGKSDGGGNGNRSLSRLAGLGRAARRQLAAILDEFWGQLYDFHGKPIPEAKVKKLDVLLAIDSKPLKVDTTRKEYGGHFPLFGGRGSDVINSSLYESPKQVKAQTTFDSPYGYPRGSLPLLSNHMQLLDAYVQNSSQIIDSSERRYSSLHTAPSADAMDYQPATVHGERRYSSLRAALEYQPATIHGEKRYSSLRAAPSADALEYQPATVHGEKRYSSLRAAPSADASEYLPATMHGEKRYSSLRAAPSADAMEYLPATVHGGRRYSSLRAAPSADTLEYQPAAVHGERRYCSLHAAPSADALEYQPATVHGERRYSSLRAAPSADALEFQPATVHGERRYSSLRAAPSADALEYQPATVHGYQITSCLNRIAKDKSSNCLNGQMELLASKAPSLAPTNYRDSQGFAVGQKLQNRITPAQAAGFQNVAVSRNSPLQPERSNHDTSSPGSNDNSGISVNSKKYHSLPDISGLSLPHRNIYMSEKSAQWNSSIGYGSTIGHTNYGTSMYFNTGSRARVPLAFDDPSQLRGSLPLQLSSSPDTGSLWSRQPFEQFGVGEKRKTAGSKALGSGFSSLTQDHDFSVDLESKLLQSFRHCIVRLLKLDGSDWLFRQNDGADEDLIDRVAAREKFLYDAETREIDQVVHMGEPQYLSSERRFGSTRKSNNASFANFSISSVPNCGEGCVWKADLTISFGVWCIHRILDLSLMESRPELWGKYTYVLNRLQGVLDLAFSKHRSQVFPCFCLQIPVEYQQKLSSPISNGSLPPASKPGRGKTTTASTLLDIIKDVEIAISCRKGRTGTAAGDVAFPKGKENLASVLKRYKRRLSTKQVGTHEGTIGSRKVPTTAPMLVSYNS